MWYVESETREILRKRGRCFQVSIQSSTMVAGRKISGFSLLNYWWGKWVLGVVIAIVFLLLPFPLGWISGGRAGYSPVKGNSMSSVFPWGSIVIIFPTWLTKPEEGDYVVAWVDRIKNPECAEDIRPSLVVKKLGRGKLVSTDSDEEIYPANDIRGKVVACIQIQKVFKWLDKGAQTTSPHYEKPATEKIIANIVRTNEERKAKEDRERWIKNNCVPLDLSSAKIQSSVGDGKLACDGNEKTFWGPVDAFGTSDFWSIDLGQRTEIFAIEIVYGGDIRAESASISHSLDGLNWKEVTIVDHPGVHFIALGAAKSISSRYWKIKLTSAVPGARMWLNEFKLFSVTPLS